MAENDRPKSDGSKGTPAINFTTNNTRSSNERLNESTQPVRKTNDSKPKETPTKKK